MSKIISYYKYFLNILRGRKASIASFLGALLVWLCAYDVIKPVDAQLISAFLFLLGLTVNYSDYRIKKLEAKNE